MYVMYRTRPSVLFLFLFLFQENFFTLSTTLTPRPLPPEILST
jgi:hypothetical protein